MSIEILKKKKMNRENHKLRSVYFIATAAQLFQLKEHGYSIVRKVKNRVYEARVTDQLQFKAFLERIGISGTVSEDEPIKQ